MRFLITKIATLVLASCTTPAMAQLYDKDAVIFDGTTTKTDTEFDKRYRAFFKSAMTMNSCIWDDVSMHDPFTGRHVCVPRKIYRQLRKDRAYMGDTN